MSDSPWLTIPLADYEAHMSLPEVAQLQALDGLLRAALAELRPRSIALIGCGPGTGLRHVDSATTRRVVAVDINREYLDVLRARYAEGLEALELVEHDVATPLVGTAPVEYAHAALIFEYVPVRPALATIVALLASYGVLDVVLQLPGDASAPVTATQFRSLQSLAPVMRLVDPAEIRAAAADLGLLERSSTVVPLQHGKRFQTIRFQRET